MGQSLFLVREMFTGFHGEAAAVSFFRQQLTPLFVTAFGAACLGAFPFWRRLEGKRGMEALSYLLSAVLLLLCMISLAGSTYNPFIYFRF